MIAANELRIGNWVQHVAPTFYWTYRTKGKDVDKPFCFQWEEEDWYAVGECKMYYGALQPIPLTPEILEKAGFEYEDMGDDSPYERWICKNYKELWVWDFNGEEWMFCLGDAFEQGGFHYLHQLQNLYFALAGEELEINL
jgi:hypothetical protein